MHLGSEGLPGWSDATKEHVAQFAENINAGYDKKVSEHSLPQLAANGDV